MTASEFIATLIYRSSHYRCSVKNCLLKKGVLTAVLESFKKKIKTFRQIY